MFGITFQSKRQIAFHTTKKGSMMFSRPLLVHEITHCIHRNIDLILVTWGLGIWVIPPSKPVRTIEGIAKGKGKLEWIKAEEDKRYQFCPSCTNNIAVILPWNGNSLFYEHAWKKSIKCYTNVRSAIGFVLTFLFGKSFADWNIFLLGNTILDVKLHISESQK